MRVVKVDGLYCHGQTDGQIESESKKTQRNDVKRPLSECFISRRFGLCSLACGNVETKNYTSTLRDS